jgi:hypothetical protein
MANGHVVQANFSNTQSRQVFVMYGGLQSPQTVDCHSVTSSHLPSSKYCARRASANEDLEEIAELPILLCTVLKL